MLYTLDENGKQNWVTKVKQILSRLGYGFVWLCQGVAEEAYFINQFKSRLVDVSSQEWMADIRQSTRFDTYVSFKTSPTFEKYLDFIKVKCFRDSLIRFRFGITELKTHKNRFVKHITNNTCPFCKDTDENEYHFLFHCDKYETIRPNILKCVERHEEKRKFENIMCCENQSWTKQLAWFLFKAFELREKMLDG